MNTGRSRRSQSGTLVAVLSLLGATLCWAGNYIVGSAAIETFSPLNLTAIRWTIAVVPLLLLAHLVERPDWRAVVRSWRQQVGPALVGLAAYNLFLYSALEHTTPINASLINAFNPALICLAAAVFFRQRLTLVNVAGIVLALLGVILILGRGSLSAVLGLGLGRGELLMLGAIGAWTFYTVIGRRSTDVPPITSTAIQCVIAIAVLSPFVVVNGMPHVPAQPGPLLVLLFIGLFPSVISYVLWNSALRTIPPARAGVFLNLITVFTVIISVALGQPFTSAQAIGGGLVISGVIVMNAKLLRRNNAS